MTRRKRIKISGTTPAEMELVEKIEQHLAIPLYNGVPGERLVLKAGIDIKQTAWAKNRMPKALTDIRFKQRSAGISTMGAVTMMSTSPGRNAWAQMMTQKSIDQQNMLKEMYEQDGKRGGDSLGSKETLSGLPIQEDDTNRQEGHGAQHSGHGAQPDDTPGVPAQLPQD